MRRRLVLGGIACAALAAVWSTAWSGAMASLVTGDFTAHMVAHVTVMALAAPLLAIALAGGAADPTRRWPWLGAPIAAMVAELVVVWGWHVPRLHDAARADAGLLVAEQASFLLVGLALWLSVLGGAERDTRPRRAAGVAALLMTSMHMTLLGVLITLSPRALYLCVAGLGDQQVAGMVMLFGGATSYLAGGLWLVHRLLQEPQGAREGGHVPLR